MLKDNKILIGKADDKEMYLLPNMANRHGLIAGASGTGKTVTLKVVAEGLSEMGVPTFLADIKGDLSGMVVQGDKDGVKERLESMGEDFDCKAYPVHFYDVYREKGMPIRAVLQEIDPVLLARIFDLNDAQEGVMNIILAAAKDMGLDIIDLKDLQAMTQYVYEHTADLSGKYGNVNKQSVSTIQRKILELQNQDGDKLFGMPGLEISDLMGVENGLGVMNIIECEKLFQHPMLYSTFLLWLLDRLYNEMPEIGDMDKPKIVFFFDEAHLLFDGASKDLLEKINQIIKLIRSKGVGIFFCTQTPTDIPDSVLAQLSNRIQHALRAYTPAEIKAVKQAAESFRENPDIDTSSLLTEMKTGHALISVLDEEGAPCVVQETKIMPPQSSMDIAPDDVRNKEIQSDALYAKYNNDVDPDSAYEEMDKVKEQEEAQKQAEAEAKQQAKLAEQQAKEEAKAAAKAEAQKQKQVNAVTKQLSNKAMNKLENEAINTGIKCAKKFLSGLLNSK